MRKIINTVVIAIGGKGTRMAPVTTVIPKQLIPIIDKPVLQYVLEEALFPDIKRIIFVGFKNAKTDLIMQYLKENGEKTLKNLFTKIKVEVTYDDPNYFGDSKPVKAVEKLVKDEPFLVLWSDSFGLRQDLRIKKLLDTYNKFQEPVLSLLKVTKRETYLYAIAKIEKIIKDEVLVEKLLEKPGPKLAPSLYAAPNGFILDKRIFPYINKLTPNKKGELSLIDAINAYCQEYKMYGSIFDGPFFEAGNKLDLARSFFRLPFYREELKDIRDDISKLSVQFKTTKKLRNN